MWLFRCFLKVFYGRIFWITISEWKEYNEYHLIFILFKEPHIGSGYYPIKITKREYYRIKPYTTGKVLDLKKINNFLITIK